MIKLGKSIFVKMFYMIMSMVPNYKHPDIASCFFDREGNWGHYLKPSLTNTNTFHCTYWELPSVVDVYTIYIKVIFKN